MARRCRAYTVIQLVAAGTVPLASDGERLMARADAKLSGMVELSHNEKSDEEVLYAYSRHLEARVREKRAQESKRAYRPTADLVSTGSHPSGGERQQSDPERNAVGLLG